MAPTNQNNNENYLLINIWYLQQEYFRVVSALVVARNDSVIL